MLNFRSLIDFSEINLIAASSHFTKSLIIKYTHNMSKSRKVFTVILILGISSYVFYSIFSSNKQQNTLIKQQVANETWDCERIENFGIQVVSSTKTVDQQGNTYAPYTGNKNLPSSFPTNIFPENSELKLCYTITNKIEYEVPVLVTEAYYIGEDTSSAIEWYKDNITSSNPNFRGPYGDDKLAQGGVSLPVLAIPVFSESGNKPDSYDLYGYTAPEHNTNYAILVSRVDSVPVVIYWSQTEVK